MEKPNKCVAIVSTIDGGCQYVAIVKTIKQSEYATLLGEQREHEKEQKRVIRELTEQINELKETCENLKKEIKVLKGEEENEESIESI